VRILCHVFRVDEFFQILFSEVFILLVKALSMSHLEDVRNILVHHSSTFTYTNDITMSNNTRMHEVDMRKGSVG
jgi:hypothetical protein